MIGKLSLLSLLFVSIGLSPIFAATPNDSIHFDDSDIANFILKGTNTITNQENPSYKLNGIGDYMILESNLPEKLNEFSISVWVKPDYKSGAPATLSIVSESSAFDLSINNDKIDKNIATFSIYDGIKWHNVDSKSEIKNTWTHLAATYSDEGISIFVNGEKENSGKVDGDYSLTHNTGGISTQHSYNYISSKSDILVGAFIPLSRADGLIKNNFSGQIDDVIIYDEILLPDQISTLYENDRISHKPIIQSIEIVSEETGIINQYGFITSSSNPNNQSIEAVASQGFKIEKLSSATDQFIISEISNNNSNPDSINENTNNQTSKILENEKQPVTEIIKHNVGTGSTSTVCHVPSGDVDGAFTLPIFPSSIDIHLNHGDTLGDCT